MFLKTSTKTRSVFQTNGPKIQIISTKVARTANISDVEIQFEDQEQTILSLMHAILFFAKKKTVGFLEKYVWVLPQNRYF